MDYHQNARLTVSLGEQLARRVVVEKSTVKQAAICFHISEKTAAKWVRRYRTEGVAGLRTAPRARTARRAEPHLLYWKRFWLFAGCVTTAGASLTHWA